MRTYVWLSGVLFALVVLVVTAGMSAWAWRLFTGPQATVGSASNRS